MIEKLINEQKVKELEQLESTLTGDDLKLCKDYLRARKEAMSMIDEKASEHEGYATLKFEHEDFKVTAEVFVSHHYPNDPINHTIEVLIEEFEMIL